MTKWKTKVEYYKRISYTTTMFDTKEETEAYLKRATGYAGAYMDVRQVYVTEPSGRMYSIKP